MVLADNVKAWIKTASSCLCVAPMLFSSDGSYVRILSWYFSMIQALLKSYQRSLYPQLLSNLASPPKLTVKGIKPWSWIVHYVWQIRSLTGFLRQHAHRESLLVDRKIQVWTFQSLKTNMKKKSKKPKRWNLLTSRHQRI